jgi:hypothetical protein
MARSNQNENVMRIEIKYYEIFQNDVFMKEEFFFHHHKEMRAYKPN